MNPDKMRSEYGKLVYMLMDSSDLQIQELLEFKCVRPLKTVYSTLKEHDLLAVLEDPLLETATAEVIAGDRPRYEVPLHVSANLFSLKISVRCNGLFDQRNARGKLLPRSMPPGVSPR